MIKHHQVRGHYHSDLLDAIVVEEVRAAVAHATAEHTTRIHGATG